MTEPHLPALDALRAYGVQLRTNLDGDTVAAFTPDLEVQRLLDLHQEMTEEAAR